MIVYMIVLCSHVRLYCLSAHIREMRWIERKGSGVPPDGPHMAGVLEKGFGVLVDRPYEQNHIFLHYDMNSLFCTKLRLKAGLRQICSELRLRGRLSNTNCIYIYMYIYIYIYIQVCYATYRRTS